MYPHEHIGYDDYQRLKQDYRQISMAYHAMVSSLLDVIEEIRSLWAVYDGLPLSEELRDLIADRIQRAMLVRPVWPVTELTWIVREDGDEAESLSSVR